MDTSFLTRLGSSPPQASLSAFERFFREQYPVVVRIAFGVTGDAQAAQDVAQDVFISAFQRFPEPGESDHACAWVRVAAAHTALNAIRGERRRDQRQQLGAGVPPAGPEETVLDEESRTEVRRALRRLPRRAATVLVLRHNGLSYAEVAEAMNVKVGHVGTMLRRADQRYARSCRMHHVASPVLRRLVDEPLAVPDREPRHLAECEHCQAHSNEIAGDAALAARMVSAPAETADVDLEWILMQDRLRLAAAQRGGLRRRRGMPRRVVHVSVGAGTAAVVGVLAVGVAAAAALTTVYAPTTWPRCR